MTRFANTPRRTREPSANEEAPAITNGASEDHSLRLYTCEEFFAFAKGEPQGWLWEDILRASGCALLVGAPLNGKTTIYSALAAAMRLGAELAGREVAEGNMIIAHLEHQATDLVRKLRAAARGIDKRYLKNVHVLREFNIDDPAQVDELDTLASKRGAKVIVIDSYRRSTRGDENASQDTDLVRRMLNRLTRGGLIGVNYFCRLATTILAGPTGGSRGVDLGGVVVVAG